MRIYVELMVGRRGRDFFSIGINRDKVPMFPQSNSHSGSGEQLIGHRKEKRHENRRGGCAGRKGSTRPQWDERATEQM